ncbi:MAG TPA: hemerythrin domain-containing protein [Pirellulales bacterium]|nr:hemerythrin domain-containing protein [Pirellulales bacterium]
MPRVFVNLGPPRESSFASPLGLLCDCHRRIESFLADMRRIAAEGRGGALSDEDRATLAGAVRYFTVAAPRHTADEEESLFPRLRAMGGRQAEHALAALRQLEDDHDHADACHAEANGLAERWLAAGTLDWSDAQRLTELLDTLHGIYREHIAVEDSTVFPAAGAALDAGQIEAIGREMAVRRGLDFDRVVGGASAPPVVEARMPFRSASERG